MALAVKSGRGLSIFAPNHHTYTVPTTYEPHANRMRNVCNHAEIQQFSTLYLKSRTIYL